MQPVRDIYDSWRDWPGLPAGWQPAGPKVLNRVKNAEALAALRATLPGRWQKVYLPGRDGTALHYFEHASGRAALLKIKPT